MASLAMQVADWKDIMKEGIHPAYKPAKVACACGNTFQTHSTMGDIHVEICSACHPFFTGKQKILDTAGRIERFKTRYAAAPAKAETKKAAPPPPPPAKKVDSKDNRATKRAKANAGKPKATPKAEAIETAAAEKPETPTAS